MEKYPFVSVVIPTIRSAKELQQCVDSLLAQDYPEDRMEVILVSPRKISISSPRIKSIVAEDGNPARNRNIGVKESRGDLIGFIDDDCYPPPDWIKKGIRYFEDEKVAIIGGPGLTPPEDPFPKRCGSYMMSSFLATGKMASRYGIDGKEVCKETDESGLILCNNFVRKDIFLEVRGFDEDQVPCEENVLYHHIYQKGYKMLFAPEIAVKHSIRPIFRPIAHRNFFYAIGRGVMLFRFPESFKALYLIPSTFLLSFILLPLLAIAFPILWGVLLIILCSYLLVNFYTAYTIYSRFEKDLRIFFIIPFGIFLVHMAYGMGLLYGIYLFIFDKWKGGAMLKKKGEY